MAKRIFAFNSRTRFFPDMQFSQNHKGRYNTWFKPKKSTHQWTFFFFAKSKKAYYWGILGQYPQNEIFPQKNPAQSVFYP